MRKLISTMLVVMLIFSGFSRDFLFYVLRFVSGILSGKG
jgi:hypothetical protein